MSTGHVEVSMRRHLATGFAVVLGLGILTGCADPNAVNGSGGPTNVTSSVGGGPSPAPTETSHSSPPIMKPPAPSTDPSDGLTTLRGTITQGAEPSCTLITDAKVEYLLLAADSVSMPPVGTSAVVTGHVEHGIMTHCQQGIPFAVTTIKQVVAPQGGVTMQPLTSQ
jgi:hypothetical protein